MKRTRSESERGQAAMEFVFALLFILAFASVLYQALHFELDVFNKMGILRFKSVQRMHYNQAQYNHEFGDDSQTVSFKPLSDVTSYRVLFQTVDTSMRYPDKRLSYKRGTKFWFPGGSAASDGLLAATLTCITVADRYEPSSGLCVQPFKVLSGVLNAIPLP